MSFSNKKLSSSCGGATTFKDIVTNLISASASGQTGQSLSPPHSPVQQTNAPTTPGTNHIRSLHICICLFVLKNHFTASLWLTHYPHSPVQQTNASTPGMNPYQDPSCDHPNYCWPVDTLDGYIVLAIRNFCEEVKQRSKFSKETNKQIKLKFKCEEL